MAGVGCCQRSGFLLPGCGCGKRFKAHCVFLVRLLLLQVPSLQITGSLLLWVGCYKCHARTAEGSQSPGFFLLSSSCCKQPRLLLLGADLLCSQAGWLKACYSATAGCYKACCRAKQLSTKLATRVPTEQGWVLQGLLQCSGCYKAWRWGLLQRAAGCYKAGYRAKQL